MNIDPAQDMTGWMRDIQARIVRLEQRPVPPKNIVELISEVPEELPIGAIVMYGGTTAPDGWLICNGASFSSSTYPDLYTHLGSTTLPDFSGVVPVGRDTGDTDFDTIWETGGEKEHTLLDNEIPSHNHLTTLHSAYAVTNDTGTGTWGAHSGGSEASTSVGDDDPHNNLQPYMVVNFIIKALPRDTGT